MKKDGVSVMSEILVSVVVLTFNRRDDLERCLKSLMNQSYKNFEVIVIEGGAAEETKKLVESYNCSIPIRFMTQTKKGLSNARNQGWMMAKGNVVSFIDDDAVASETWLAKVVRTFQLDPKIGGVTGPTIIPEERIKYRDLFQLQTKLRDGKEFVFWRLIGKVYFNIILEGKPFEVGKIFRSGAFSLGSNYQNSINLLGIVEVDYLEACNMSFRKEAIELVGGFDSRYTGTAEWNEPDICFRIKKIGYKLFSNPKALVEHHVTRSGVFGARVNAYERSRNFVYFYFKNIGFKSVDNMLRFMMNLIVFNGYWFYKFYTTKQVQWLTGIKGTMDELVMAMHENFSKSLNSFRNELP